MVREIPAGSSTITTVAGTGYLGFSGDGGSARLANFCGPEGLALDSSGALLVTDGCNRLIRKVTFTSAGAAALPVFSVPGGSYSTSQSVAISDTTPGAVIYYTTDGTAPSVRSTVYSSPITISQSETLQAVAVAPGYGNSAIAAAVYTISSRTTPTVPTITITPSAATVTDEQPLSVKVSVVGASGAPLATGSVTLAAGSYGADLALTSGSATFDVPAGDLHAGSVLITAIYSGDAAYAGASGSASITVESVLAIAAPPAPVSPGGSSTSKVTFTAGSYAGTMNLSCALKSSPAGAQSVPACTVNPASMTLIAGGQSTVTVSLQTTAASTTAHLEQGSPIFRLFGGSSAALAMILWFGIPARRRRWRASLVLLIAVSVVGVLGCAGGSGSHGSQGSTTPATTAGDYVFLVTGTDTANSTLTASASVTLTVQ